MGNINCCKKPDEEKKDEELMKDEDINQLDKDGYPHDSVQVNREGNNQNEEEIKNLPNNEEIEVGSGENQKEEEKEEQKAQNEEQQNIEDTGANPQDQNAEEQEQEHINEENQQQEHEQEQEPEHEQEQEQEQEHEEEQEQPQEQEQEQEQEHEQIQEQEQEQEHEQPQEQEHEQIQEQIPHEEVNQQQLEQEQPVVQGEYAAQQELIPQADINQNLVVEQHIAEQKNEVQDQTDINKYYENLVGQTMGQTTYDINQNIQQNDYNYTNYENYTNNIENDINSYINTNDPNTIVMKDADEVNRYFSGLVESTQVKVNNEVIPSTTTQNVVNIDTNTYTNANIEDEDLNKYFQPGSYTQNQNFDLASLGLSPSTTVQGAANADEINQYFQNIDNNTYTTQNNNLIQQNASVTNTNNGNLNYSEYKTTVTKTTYAPQSASYSNVYPITY